MDYNPRDNHRRARIWRERKYFIKRTILVSLQVIAVALAYGLLIEWDYWHNL